MRLNQYISHAGICSRRKAIELIKQGLVKVNGELSDHPAYLVEESDEVEVRGTIVPREKRIYLLLNKPKNYLCTLSDPRDRKTVVDLLGPKIKTRIYPVGRLDRGTTGLLILTNDGDLSHGLAHPKSNVTKVYTATLSADVKFAHLKKMVEGVLLDDGKARFDEVTYVPGKNKKTVRISLHSGRNRVIRRMFQALGYMVLTLDRGSYAGLRKQNLPRGEWRYLTPHEVKQLKELGSL